MEFFLFLLYNQESSRENFMHGLMRGKRAKPSNLLYTGLKKKNQARIIT